MSMSLSSLQGEVEGREKCRCVDLGRSFVENPSSASATVADSGTSAEGTGGSIFEILAGRKALKCPCEADIVNSASATAGKKMRHSEDLGQYVGENPRDASERRSRHRSERYQRILMKRQQQGGITKSRPKKSVIMPAKNPFDP